MRIHEIAKELGTTSPIIRAKLDAAGYTFSSYSTKVSAAVINDVFGGPNRVGDERDERDLPMTLGWAKKRISLHQDREREMAATIGRLEHKVAVLDAALNDAIAEHAEAMRQINRAAKVGEYGFDRGYWSAMKDVLCHLNAWEAAGLGQPINNDDGRYDGFDDSELMLRHQIGCFFDGAHAGWGEQFPTFEEWSA